MDEKLDSVCFFLVSFFSKTWNSRCTTKFPIKTKWTEQLVKRHTLNTDHTHQNNNKRPLFYIMLIIHTIHVNNRGRDRANRQAGRYSTIRWFFMFSLLFWVFDFRKKPNIDPNPGDSCECKRILLPNQNRTHGYRLFHLAFFSSV